MITNLPNILTMGRILAIPLLFGLYWLPGDMGNWIAFGLYTAACITDFFDGYLARATGQTSALGRFLDPIADKLLVATVLILLAGAGALEGWHLVAGAIILAREITVSGLREYLGQFSVSVPVSQLAKWKTLFQMLSLGFLIAGDAGPWWSIPTGLTLLWISAVVTVYTGYDYLKAGLKYMADEDANRI